MSGSERVLDNIIERLSAIRSSDDDLPTAIDREVATFGADESRVLLTIAVRARAGLPQYGSGEKLFCEGVRISATEVAPVVSDLLEAVDIELFELAMWQGWARR